MKPAAHGPSPAVAAADPDTARAGAARCRLAESPPGRCPQGRCPRGALRRCVRMLWLLALAACGPAPGPAEALRPAARSAGRQTEPQDESARHPSAQRVSLESAPSAQLAAAQAARARLRQLEPRARLHARLALAEAWRAAAAHPGADAGERAEALLGAGECLSALGFHGEAQQAFEAAAAFSPDPAQSAEAWLQAAHNARRAGSPETALGRYERAALAAQGLGSAHSIAAVAGLWAARVELDRCSFESAALRFEALAESRADPLLRLAAFDELALLALAQADPEGAAGWIQRARQCLAEPAAAQTESGRRLRRALAHLRALPELVLAIEERARGQTYAPTRSGAESQLRFPSESDD